MAGTDADLKVLEALALPLCDLGQPGAVRAMAHSGLANESRMATTSQ